MQRSTCRKQRQYINLHVTEIADTEISWIGVKWQTSAAFRSEVQNRLKVKGEQIESNKRGE